MILEVLIFTMTEFTSFHKRVGRLFIAAGLALFSAYPAVSAAEDGGGKPPEKPTSMSPQYVTPTRWFSVTGGAFVPAASGYAYALPNGCLHQNTFANLQDAQYRAGVYLPDGAVSKSIYFNYNIVTSTVGLISSAGLARQSTTSLASLDLANADKTTAGTQGFG